MSLTLEVADRRPHALKTWLVAALGLGSLVILIALIAVSMFVSTRRAQDISAQLDELGAHHRG